MCWVCLVSSVAQSFTGGIVSVAGSPITTSGTLALTVAGYKWWCTLLFKRVHMGIVNRINSVRCCHWRRRRSRPNINCRRYINHSPSRQCKRYAYLRRSILDSGCVWHFAKYFWWNRSEQCVYSIWRNLRFLNNCFSNHRRRYSRVCINCQCKRGSHFSSIFWCFNR